MAGVSPQQAHNVRPGPSGRFAPEDVRLDNREERLHKGWSHQRQAHAHKMGARARTRPWVRQQPLCVFVESADARRGGRAQGGTAKPPSVLAYDALVNPTE